MKTFLRVLAVCMGLSLTACGGGGSGNAGTPVLGNAAAALFSSAPSSLTIEAGGIKASVFSIGGGKRPYTVTSSDSAVVASGQSAEDSFSLTGVKPGSATVTIKDAIGQSVSIAVTTRASRDLSVTAPGTLALALNESQSFVIAGGSPPFAATSTNASVARVMLTGSDFSITGLRTGSAQISLVDSNGSRVSVDVAVSAGLPLFSTVPAALALFVDTSQPYKVGGGVPPYSIGSSSPGVLSASLNGGDLTLKGLAVGSASLVVTDAAGTTSTISAVSVTRAQQLAVVMPNPVTLKAPLTGQAAAPATYPIAGAILPVVARSSDESVAKVSVDLSSGQATLNVLPVAAGTARLLLSDALGTQFSADVNVTSPAVAPLIVTPGAATAVVGDVLTFTVNGGRPDSAGLYTIRSNNPGVVTVPETAGSSFRATLASPGSTVVTVIDALGQIQAVTVTSQPNVSALYTSAPATVVFTNGAAQQFTVGGGTGNYIVQSSNLAVATVAQSGSTLKVTPADVGTATITVGDSAGAQRSFSVTVQPALQLTTTAPTVGVTLVPSVVPTGFEIIGGRTPYAVASSNPSVARGQIAGESLNILNVTPVAAGAATVTVTDATGTRTLVNVTVSPSGTAALAVTPGAAAGTVGDVLTFTVAGGTPNGSGSYTVRSNNSSVLTVPPTASPTFGATLVNAGATVISVFDSQGQVQNVNVTVGSTPTAIRLAPSAITVGENLRFSALAPSNKAELKVVGGTVTGNARVFSSDVRRILVTSNGRTITLTEGSYGSLCFRPADGATTLGAELPVVITVIDDLGASATMTVTIRNEVTSATTGDPPQQLLTSCE